MISSLLKRLSQPEDTTPLAGGDARLALTALLVRLARTDGDYAPAEIDRIDRILAACYAMSPFEAARLRGEAEGLEAEAPDTVRFTRAIKEAVAYEDRLAVIEAAWSVVLADGERADQENALMRMVANLLGVSDIDSHLARQRAEDG